jgi:hypothetical protein
VSRPSAEEEEEEEVEEEEVERSMYSMHKHLQIGEHQQNYITEMVASRWLTLLSHHHHPQPRPHCPRRRRYDE